MHLVLRTSYMFNLSLKLDIPEIKTLNLNPEAETVPSLSLSPPLSPTSKGGMKVGRVLESPLYGPLLGTLRPPSEIE